LLTSAVPAEISSFADVFYTMLYHDVVIKNVMTCKIKARRPEPHRQPDFIIVTYIKGLSGLQLLMLEI